MLNTFRAEAKDNHGDVYLYGEIGDGWFGGTSADDIIEQIKELGDLETMTLHVNSPGGNPFDGVAIRSTLIKHSAVKNVEVDGLAASAATIAIAIPGANVEMAKGSRYMIHNPWTITMGEVKEHEKAIRILDGVRNDMIGIYADRTGLGKQKIADMMDEETWLSADDAVDHGFADTVSEGEAVAALMPPDLCKHFKNMPDELSPNAEKIVFQTGVKSSNSRLREARIKLAKSLLKR